MFERNKWTNEQQQQQIGWSHTLSMRMISLSFEKKKINRTLSIADYVYGLWGVHAYTHSLIHNHFELVDFVHSFRLCLSFALGVVFGVFVAVYECVPRLPCSCLVNHKHINIQSPLSSSWSASTTQKPICIYIKSCCCYSFACWIFPFMSSNLFFFPSVFFFFLFCKIIFYSFISSKIESNGKILNRS